MINRDKCIWENTCLSTILCRSLTVIAIVTVLSTYAVPKSSRGLLSLVRKKEEPSFKCSGFFDEDSIDSSDDTGSFLSTSCDSVDISTEDDLLDYSDDFKYRLKRINECAETDIDRLAKCDSSLVFKREAKKIKQTYRKQFTKFREESELDFGNVSCFSGIKDKVVDSGGKGKSKSAASGEPGKLPQDLQSLIDHEEKKHDQMLFKKLFDKPFRFQLERVRQGIRKDIDKLTKLTYTPAFEEKSERIKQKYQRQFMELRRKLELGLDDAKHKFIEDEELNKLRHCITGLIDEEEEKSQQVFFERIERVDLERPDIKVFCKHIQGLSDDLWKDMVDVEDSILAFKLHVIYGIFNNLVANFKSFVEQYQKSGNLSRLEEVHILEQLRQEAGRFNEVLRDCIGRVELDEAKDETLEFLKEVSGEDDIRFKKSLMLRRQKVITEKIQNFFNEYNNAMQEEESPEAAQKDVVNAWTKALMMKLAKAINLKFLIPKWVEVARQKEELQKQLNNFVSVAMPSGNDISIIPNEKLYVDLAELNILSIRPVLLKVMGGLPKKDTLSIVKGILSENKIDSNVRSELSKLFFESRYSQRELLQSKL